jgi:hypothetical protein|tara:strand:- start:356 stop:1006 length:651 start_codon:yes stop_codon:yes gene_type:complete
MAYKYFTEKLLSSDTLDLGTVFPEKQELARESNNVSYNLADIVLFLKDRTENFKRVESQYVDLDNAISEIVNKFYKSKGEKNPFVEELDEESLAEFESKTPREAAIVDKGEIKSKGAPKAAPDVEKKKSAPEKKPESKKAEEPKKSSPSDKLVKFKEELANRKEIFDDVYDDDEKSDFIQLMQDKLEGDEVLAEDGDEYFVQRVEILKDFIKQLKK